MSKIGYGRASTKEQNLDRQIDALTNAGCSKLFLEKVSGKNMDRPELKKMLEYIREGDVLYITSYSRLARSTKDLLHIVDELTKKGVELVSIKESLDTTTPQGKFMLTVFAGFSEFERELMLERQAEGIASAKARGVKFGNSEIPVPEDFEVVYKVWKSKEITAVKAFSMLGLKKTTFYKMVKDYEQNTS